jgi:16S rRNA (cytosine1402-N4)-methyltransferase
MTHTPVLLQETLTALNVQRKGIYIDATFGLGGHTKEILSQGGKVLGIEWDQASLERRQKELSEKELILVSGNFADIEQIAHEHGYDKVDGILFDLGLSMWQIRESGRGFSYEKDDEPLDMRIGEGGTQTAADIINSYSEQQLYDIFTKNAEELNSRAIAHIIVQSRRLRQIDTVGELKKAIQHVGKGTSTLARIFQALRIEVNSEFDNVTRGLDGALSLLKSDGRIVVITFHPSEDRIVKQWIRGHKDRVLASKKAVRSKMGQRFERSALLRVITHK